LPRASPLSKSGSCADNARSDAAALIDASEKQLQKTPPPPKKAKDKEPAPAPAEGPSGTAHGEVEIWPPNRDNSKWYVEVYNACDDSYTGIGKFTSEVSAEEDAEKVKDAAVEERFTIKYQNEYWQNEVDDDRLQALIDGTATVRKT
jgi:hypothetical protein